jgi:hypothetical protein
MAGHSVACQGSTALCDALLQELQHRIPGVERTSGEQWCSVFRVGKKRLAYVTHFKTSDRVQIWCRGEPAELRAEPAVSYEERQPTDSGWGSTFKGRFDISDAESIPGAADVLFRHSYSRS